MRTSFLNREIFHITNAVLKMHQDSKVILEELISFFETDKHTQAYHIDG